MNQAELFDEPDCGVWKTSESGMHYVTLNPWLAWYGEALSYWATRQQAEAWLAKQRRAKCAPTMLR